jgi:hypothetical protein
MVPPWFLQSSIRTGKDLKNEQASIPSRTPGGHCCAFYDRANTSSGPMS